MNRREAIKKLGVGGAIVAAPVVIPSFSVAHAASPTGPPSPPPTGTELIVASQAGFNAWNVAINPSMVTCGGSTPAVMTVQWRITSYFSIIGGQLQVRNPSTNAMIVSATPTSTPSAWAAGPTTVKLQRSIGLGTNFGGFGLIARVTWTCGGSSIVTEDYNISKNAFDDNVLITFA